MGTAEPSGLVKNSKMINGYIDAINRIAIQPFTSLRPFLHRAAALICRILCRSLHHHPPNCHFLASNSCLYSFQWWPWKPKRVQHWSHRKKLPLSELSVRLSNSRRSSLRKISSFLSPKFVLLWVLCFFSRKLMFFLVLVPIGRVGWMLISNFQVFFTWSW